MSDAVLLDALFLLCALLLVPIGYRRGVVRETFVTAGVLAGAALSASWARPWGSDLADLVNVRIGIGQFAISAAFILGGTVLIGYGGAVAARLDRPETWARITGALLAVINGALVSAYLLKDIERFLADDGTDRSLKESDVAWTLLRQFGWVALGSALLMLGVVAIGLITGDRRALPSVSAAGQPTTWSRESRLPGRRRRRLGWSGDEGKVEPEVAADASFTASTMVIAPVDSATWSVDRAGGQPSAGSEWIQVATAGGAPIGATVDSGAQRSRTNESFRCNGCGELLTARDAFCPRCGRGRKS